jgi:DNA replication protein DnaC
MKGIETLLQSSGSTTTKNLCCPVHGDYQGWTMTVAGEEINSICDKCADEEQRQKAQAAEEERERLRNAVGFSNSCIPPRFAKMAYNDFKTNCDKAVAVKGRVGDFIKNFKDSMGKGTSFLFSGSTGTGKTHLACATANNIIRKGYSAIYVSSLNYLSKVKAAWNVEAGTSEDEVIESYVKFDLLILDELGKGELNQKERGMIFRLIDRRSEECKPTIGITKFSPDKLISLIDDDAVRRLKAGGGGVLLFDWPAYE